MSLRPCRPCPRPRFIPIGPVEEAKVQDDITPQAQHSLGNLKLDLSDSLTALEVIAIADDPRHPDVGRQHQSGSLALQAAGRVVLPEPGKPISRKSVAISWDPRVWG